MKRIIIAVAALLLVAVAAYGVQTTKTTDIVQGTMQLLDDLGLIFGTGSDVTVKYDEAGTDRLTVTTAAGYGLNVLTGNLYVGNGVPGQTVNGEDAYIEGLLEVDGVANFDGGAKIIDDVALTFGSDADATIVYDETTTDDLIITSTNVTVTGNVNFSGQLVGTGTAAIGSVVAGANTACNTTCTAPCLFGIDNGAAAADSLVACDDAAADKCVCLGAS
ncbi:hypothetical protein [Zavarzinia sp.]|uniref:hypothetical protein n=1 Tax=Zavarzinia sp. TaxID=2027920 RepID=UPI00356981D1